MHAVRSRLATSAVAVMLAFACGYPVATATEGTIADPTPIENEEGGALDLEGNSNLEDSRQTDDGALSDESEDTESSDTPTQTDGTGPELRDGYVTYADENPSFAVTCAYLINTHGNLVLDLSHDALLEQGFEVGDTLSVSICGTSIDIPLCNKMQEVPVGGACIYRGESNGSNWAVFAANGSRFVEELGLATATTDEAGKVTWVVREDIGKTMDVVFTLKERGGNADASDIAALSYTDAREDYPHLTDDEFANFREVAFGNIAKGVLYRSSSPIDPRHNRNAYADAAIKRVGVTHAIDLADTEDALATFEGYSTSYFAQISHIALAMSMGLTTEANMEKLLQGIRYMIDNPDGVFVVHCLEGKDRTGLFIAILESLEGATFDEVIDDYMTSYYNFYGVIPQTEIYTKIWSMVIKRQLEFIFNVDDLSMVSLPDTARNYLLALGITEDELESLHNVLTRTQAEDPTPQPDPAPQPQPAPAPQPQPAPAPQPQPAPAPQPYPALQRQPYPRVQPQPYLDPYPVSRTYVFPYEPWNVGPRLDATQREVTQPYPYAYAYRNNRAYDVPQPDVRPYGYVSVETQPRVRTYQFLEPMPQVRIAGPDYTLRSALAYRVVNNGVRSIERALRQFIRPYDTMRARFGYPSSHYRDYARDKRRALMETLGIQPWAYGTSPYRLNNRMDSYPWQWYW